MAAPSLFDGVARAVEEFGLPPIALLALVGVVRITYGGQAAGVVYVVLTGALLFGIYTAAKYWNVRYTLGVVAVGFILWVGVPGFIPLLVPSPFAELGTVTSLVFLIALAIMLTEKLS